MNKFINYYNKFTSDNDMPYLYIQNKGRYNKPIFLNNKFLDYKNLDGDIYAEFLLELQLFYNSLTKLEKLFLHKRNIVQNHELIQSLKSKKYQQPETLVGLKSTQMESEGVE